MSKEKSSVLITGTTGFLGSHLADFYMNRNYAVIGADNFCSGFAQNKIYLEGVSKNTGSSFHFYESDVSQPWSFLDGIDKETLKSVKFVFHFASPASPPIYQRLPLETIQVNTQGLIHALEFAETVNARLVFASTSEIYGDPAVHPQVEEYWGNVNSYGLRSCYDEAKRLGEAILYTFNQRKPKHGLVRIFNTYGPRMNPQDGRVIVNMLDQALKGEALTVYGDGSQSRSFCYVDDLISAISKYTETDITYPINIGNPTEFTIEELANKILGIFKEQKLEKKYLPLPKDDPKQRKPDISKARQLLKWQPQIALEDGLVKMIEWLKEIER